MNMAEKAYSSTPRPVVALSQKGEVIGYYKSMSEASRMNNLCFSLIYKAVHKDMYVHGVKWMFEEDYRAYWLGGRTEELCYSKKKRNSDAMKKVWDQRSEEYRSLHGRKISETKKLKGWEYMKNAVQARRKRVYCITNGKVYNSCKEFASDIGMSPDWVSFSIREGKKVGGYFAVYMDNNEVIDKLLTIKNIRL